MAADVTLKSHPKWDTLGIDTWQTNNKRARKEIRRQLEIWKLRIQGKSFSEIARIVKSNKEQVEKAFYRAFELTQGKKYDADAFKKIITDLNKDELKQHSCESCSKRKTCKELCPEVKRLLDIEKDYTKETLLPDLDRYLANHSHKSIF